MWVHEADARRPFEEAGFKYFLKWPIDCAVSQPHTLDHHSCLLLDLVRPVTFGRTILPGWRYSSLWNLLGARRNGCQRHLRSRR